MGFGENYDRFSPEYNIAQAKAKGAFEDPSQWANLDKMSQSLGGLSLNTGILSNQYGFGLQTPGGENLPAGRTPYNQFSSFIQNQYGMDVSDFMGASQQQRIGQYYKTQGSPYDEEGLPTRAPRSSYEAGEFSFQTAQWARKRAMQDQQNEIASLQYAIGLSFQAPGSLAALQSPYISQMAQAYRAREYELPDYSLWMIPERWR